MKYLVATTHTADKDKDSFKASMAASLGVDVGDIILVPAGVAVTPVDVPGPAVAKTAAKKDKDGHAVVEPAEITRLCKQLHEEEGGPHAHAETHEETVKLLTEIGEPAVPELRKWSATGSGPGNKRCADLADHLDKKHKETKKEEKDRIAEEKAGAKAEAKK